MNGIYYHLSFSFFKANNGTFLSFVFFNINFWTESRSKIDSDEWMHVYDNGEAYFNKQTIVCNLNLISMVRV